MEKRVSEKYAWECIESENTQEAKPVFKHERQALSHQWRQSQKERSQANTEKKEGNKKQWGEKIGK